MMFWLRAHALYHGIDRLLRCVMKSDGNLLYLTNHVGFSRDIGATFFIRDAHLGASSSYSVNEIMCLYFLVIEKYYPND